MYTKTCKCYCWAALNKVSLLLISSLYCCCFFSHSAVVNPCPVSPCRAAQGQLFLQLWFLLLLAEVPVPGPSHWALGSILPSKAIPLPSHLTASTRWVRTPLLTSTFWRRCQCCWCPVSSPGSFLSASLGNHMDKALVTAARRTKSSHFTWRFSDLRVNFG